jgi:hypothetical protein
MSNTERLANSGLNIEISQKKKTTGGQGTQENELPLKSPGAFLPWVMLPFLPK